MIEVWEETMVSNISKSPILKWLELTHLEMKLTSIMEIVSGVS